MLSCLLFVAFNISQNQIEKFSRRLMCPTKLRHTMKRFGVEHLQQSTTQLKRRGEIDTIISNGLSTTRGHMKNQLLHLRSLVGKEQNEIDKEFQKAWSMFKTSLPDVEDENYIRQLSGNKETPKLSSNICETIKEALHEFIAEETVDEAQKIWKKQNSSSGADELLWKGNGNDLYMEVSVVLDALSIDRSFRRLKEYKWLSIYEKLYALDTLLIKKFFSGSVIDTDEYKKCKTVLYFAFDSEIDEIKNNLAKDNPGTPFFELSHKYCSGFSRLWDLVSIVDEHTAGVESINEKCIPGEEDYKYYIKGLVSSGKSELAYIAQTLYSEKTINTLKNGDSKEDIPTFGS